MNNKLRIGNLPPGTEEDQLLALFSGNGRHVSSVRILNDRETGQSTGIALIEMDSPEDAQIAVQLLNGHEFLGRSLTVSEASVPKAA